jgi:DNA-binding transcriptional regulator LsrR (DeoR family)
VLELTQADVAAFTGLSRQTVNLELGRLEERGLVELAFRRIKIADVDRLRDRSAAAHGDRRLARFAVASH